MSSDYLKHPPILAAAFLLPAAVILYVLMRTPEPISKASYEVVQAMYSAASMRDPDRIKKAMLIAEEAENTGRITSSEAEQIRSVAAMGLEGSWPDAQTAAWNLMKEQQRD